MVKVIVKFSQPRSCDDVANSFEKADDLKAKEMTPACCDGMKNKSARGI